MYKQFFLTSIFIAAIVGAAEHGFADTSKPWSQADAYFDPEDMSESRHHVRRHHGGKPNFLVAAERLEYQVADNTDTFLWDLDGWYGGDINKLWIKSEGDYSFSEDNFEEAEIQALWSRAITTHFDLQTGVRGDFEPDRRVHGVLGIQGDLPYRIEIDAAAFVSGEGDVTARIEAEYEILVTQRVSFHPRLELELSAQRIPELDIGAGASGLDVGLRVRYAVSPEIAPYVGVEWHASFGDTADIIRSRGDDPTQAVLVIGLSAWF